MSVGNDIVKTGINKGARRRQCECNVMGRAQSSRIHLLSSTVSVTINNCTKNGYLFFPYTKKPWQDRTKTRRANAKTTHSEVQN